MNKSKRILATILFFIAMGCLFIAAVLFFKHRMEDGLSQIAINNQKPPIETPAVIESIPMETPLPESTQSIASTSKPGSDSTTASQPTSTTEPTPTPEPTSAPVANPYADSYLANKDMAGWLQIPGTVIDYPIMWTPGDENYYLYKDFNGKKNSNGSLILDTDSSLSPLTTNLIIHGHNMKSGAMFGNLTDYEKFSYYEDHKNIILHTRECQRNYEVIAVFRSQVYRKTDEVFKFYKFFQANTEEEFNDFYDNIKKLSLYDTGVTAKFGDRFITLSTCVYHVENGRFVVVAKEIEPGETYLPVE